MLQTGTILISAPLLDDPYFEQVVIFIAEHNEKGALGFVVNQLFPRKFNELVEFKQSLPFPLYAGGPVEKEGIFFIHRRPDLIAAGKQVAKTVYWGGDFQQAVRHINDQSVTAADIRLFIGYSGWDDQQLEEEIAEGSWLVVEASIETIFSTDVTLLWETLQAQYYEDRNI